MRYFNITGRCVPEKHYMVQIDDKLLAIRAMVDKGDYFIINRARQFGKTTTLHMLSDILKNDYAVIFLDFQKMSEYKFMDEHIFSVAFAKYLLRTVRNRRNPVQGLCSSVLIVQRIIRFFLIFLHN